MDRTSKKLVTSIPHLQPTTVVLVHILEFSTLVDDLISVQLISLNKTMSQLRMFISSK